METFIKFYFFSIIYTTHIFDLCITTDSICPNRKSHIIDGHVVYFNKNVCCDNYELRGDQCVECNPGFFRPDDLTPEECIPCEKGTFGKKCAYTCTCYSNERCNSITGCVLKQDGLDDTTHGSTNDRRNRISYGIAIGVVLIFIFILIFTVIIKKRIQISRAEISIPSVNSIHIPLTNQAVGAVALNSSLNSIDVPITNQAIGSAALNSSYQYYEEIDETAFDDINEYQEVQFESDSDSKDGSQDKSTQDDEGYVNPYHSLISSPQNRTYSTLNLANE